jgi:hypothetical protein
MFQEDDEKEKEEETALAPDAVDAVFEGEDEDEEVEPEEAAAGFDEFGGDKEQE